MPIDQCPHRKLLTNYWFGQVDEASGSDLDLHLADCEDCSRFLRTIDRGTDRDDDGLVKTLRDRVTAGKFDDEPQLHQSLKLISELFITRPREARRSLDKEPAEQVREDTRSPPEASESSPISEKEIQGESLGPYRLLKVIGQGGMGRVFLAEHSRLGMVVALKVLADDRTDDPQATARFDQEMKAVGRLNHPNIVRATDAGEYHNKHFLAMEFIDGRDLGKVCRAVGTLSVADSCEVVRQAAIAIQHAHDHGLIHRDLKPSNLMLSRDGQIKLLDLGLARLNASASDGLTGDFQVMGTADYMAPEQARSDHKTKLDRRVDIYSLGCTLYALLSGRAPFGDDDHSTPLQKIIAHQQEAPLPIGEFRGDVPPALMNVIEKAMAKSPADRFETSSEFANALEPFSSGSDLLKLQQTSNVRLARRQALTDTSKSGFLAATTVTPTVAPEDTTGRHSPPPRRRIFLFTLAVCTAILLATLTLIFRTPKGTIVVEIQAEEIASRLEGERLVIEDKANANVYYLSIADKLVEQRLTPGDYRIKVENESTGLQLETQEFRIARDKKTAIKAYITPESSASASTAPVPETKPDTFAEHSLARWAISQGADLYVQVDGTPQIIRNVDQIPEGNFVIDGINFKRPLQLDEENWRRLRANEGLRHLEFQDTELTDQFVDELAAFPFLAFIKLRYDERKPQGMEKLSRLQDLFDLDVGGQLLGDEDVAQLSPLENVGRLTVSGRQVTDAGLVHLSEMKQLQFISLIFTKINGTGLVHLQKLPKLDSLHLPYTQVDDRAADFLVGMPALQWLNLSFTNVGDKTVEQLSQLKKLETLELAQTNITSKSLTVLTKMTSLRSLDLQETFITDQEVEQLAMLTQLTTLNVGNRLSADGVNALRSRLPNCQIISTTPLAESQSANAIEIANNHHKADVFAAFSP